MPRPRLTSRRTRPGPQLSDDRADAGDANIEALHWAIMCTDNSASWPRDPSRYRRDAIRDGARLPLYGAFTSNITPNHPVDAWTEAVQDAGMDPRLDRDVSNCSIARPLEIVGEKWTILILREAWYSSSRFSDIERVLGCPRNLLAARLRMLVDEGIPATGTYKEPGSRSRPKYVITPTGMDLVPALPFA